MSNFDFNDLRRHVGHKIVCVCYGQDDVQNVSIECEDCYEVLLSYDNEGDDDKVTEVITKNTKIKAWYMENYPTDDIGEDIKENVTFQDILSALDKHEDVYEVFGVGDSVIRERIFSALCEIMEVPYEYIHKQWLRTE